VRPGYRTTEFLGPHALGAALVALAWDSAAPDLVRLGAAIGAAIMVQGYPKARAVRKAAARTVRFGPDGIREIVGSDDEADLEPDDEVRAG
jgi:hypothetical protein